MKIGQYCQRQRCRHTELKQFRQAFASRWFVSDSWAFLSIFTECCQKVQLPAALLTCFLCALTVFYVNVRYFLLTVSVGISSLHLLDVPIKLIFIDSCGNPYMGNADKTLTVSLTKSRYRRNMQSQYSVKF